MSRLSEKLASGEKVFTAEITPPKGAGIKKMLKHAELISSCVDAINITDCQRALVRMSSMAACKVLKDAGFETVFQLTCRDRNSIALQADLMGASAMGIPNLLCLTGDPVKVGDCPDSKSVFEKESVGLLKMVANLQAGRDSTDKKMNLPTKFYVGSVVNPTIRNQSQIARFYKKVEAGAQFFQTQANYDDEDFLGFLKQVKDAPTKIIAGILILHSYDTAKFIKENIPGIYVPDSILQKYEKDPQNPDIGVNIAVESMKALAPHCSGFHLMTIREEDLIVRVWKEYHGRT